MLEHWTEYSRFFTALLVIVDPFAAVPIFLMLTRSYTPGERSRAALVAAFSVSILLCVSAIAGESLLGWMGTSLASFRVGGGMVLLFMALAMLRGQTDLMRANTSETSAAQAKETIAVVPVAIPLLAGPGAISTVIIEMHRSTEPYHGVAVIAVILVLAFILWLVLRAAEPLSRVMGQIGLNIANRLFGLILTAIAVEIMANGLRELFPVLAG